VRLTRRGRLVVALATGSVVLAIGWTAHLSTQDGSAQRPAGQLAPARGTSVVVRPGQTLWGIANRVDPRGDPRVMVARIEKANGLTGPAVHPGQRLLVPAA
jgi:LysM repeat protein